VTRTLLAAFRRAEEAAEAVSAIIAAGVIPAALEFFDRTVAAQLEAFSPGGYPLDAEATLLVDVDGTPEEVARDLPVVEAELRRHAGVVQRADDDAARAAMWRGRLLAGHALAASGYDYYISDVTVPRERIPDMQRAVYAIAERVGLTIGIVGHAGDGNIHPNILYHRDDPSQVAAMKTAAEEIVVASLKLGGTLTGEHGVGSEKRDHMRLHFSPAEIAAMRAVKETFDPHGILNPGILLPDPASDEPELPLLLAAIRRAVSGRLEGRSERWGDEAAGGPATDAQTRSLEQVDANPEKGIALDIPNLTVRVAAQVQIGELQQALAARGFRCAVTGDVERNGDRSVGVVIGDSACRLAVRDSLLGVRVVLPEGQPARFGGSAVKDVAGYDLKRLYIGSGKAFGSIREATFRVQP
jgi:glycolate oxidase